MNSIAAAIIISVAIISVTVSDVIDKLIEAGVCL